MSWHGAGSGVVKHVVAYSDGLADRGMRSGNRQGTRMFIERSSARIRLARTLFVLFGVLPCAGLCGWAAVRHSSFHREALERRCEQVIGLPLRIGSVEHVRPNAMRLHDCRLSAPSGGVVLAMPAIEIESLDGEVRVTMARLDCTPELARVLAGLAAEWLRRPARFPVDCVVDVDDFSWRQRRLVAAGAAQPEGSMPVGMRSGTLHVECVAANGSRAIRLRRSGGGGAAADEVRVVVGPLTDAGGAAHAVEPEAVGAPGKVEAGSLEVHGTLVDPLPIALLGPLAGLEEGEMSLGDEAAVSGTITATLDRGRWSGSAQGRIERIDLAEASLHLPHRAAGEVVLAVDRLEWSRGKITACECQCSVSRGRLGQRLLDACVSVLGCRPGPAYRSLAREEVRSFDDASAVLRIDAAGIDLRAAPGRAGALARVQGLSILDEPPAPAPLDRLAWLLSPPGTAAVPASKATAWLLEFFSVDAAAGAVGTGAGAAGFSGNPPVQAGRPQRRSEF
jgi:hypothetical protein